MPVPAFDLQSHSTQSDGTLPPAQVVAAAARAGVELLALSDHDTVDGVPEALEAARREGIGLATAVEISTVHGEHEDLHLLGYGIDHTDPHLLAELERYRGDRAARADRMADALREQGFELDDAPLAARRAAGKPIGRPHLAQAAFDHPANAARIAEEGLDTFSDLLVAYLIAGTPAYRRRTFPTVADAIALVHDAGGVAVWAHPFWDVEADRAALDTIDGFREIGLDGVEVFYVTHTPDQIALLADHCAEHGLLTTGSSDFHGPDHPTFSRFLAHDLRDRTPQLGPIRSAV
ncbi:MAG TPA: PHP domain-containing protein [Solirubrobacteraceae bacterium]|nr:PHP domain-containing protein [Solirubrobacteraceae bacterium]